MEAGALVGLALGPHAAAVALGDPPHVGEADADALEILDPVQALEDSEELGRVGHVEADAVVAHEEGEGG